MPSDPQAVPEMKPPPDGDDPLERARWYCYEVDPESVDIDVFGTKTMRYVLDRYDALARALAESEERAERLTAALEEYLIGMSYMDGDWTHEHCDEDSGGNHHLDLDWWAKDARAALLEGEPDAV